MGASHGNPKVGEIRLGKTKIRSTAVSSASAKLNRDAGSFFIHLVRHVGTADQRAAEYILEADGKSIVAIGRKPRRRDVGRDPQVPASRLQVLTDGGDVNTCIA